VTTSSGVLLGGYPAKQCARRTHNSFSPQVPASAKVAPPAEVAERMANGVAFENLITTMLMRACPDAVHVEYGDHLDDKVRRLVETVTAMNAGAPMIVGGQLPDDTVGSRTGSPDVLVRVSGEGEPPTYLPADIKHHKTLDRKEHASFEVSTFASPTHLVTQVGATRAPAHSFNDAMQLMHYTRMLEAAGRHPGPSHMKGAIIGTTNLSDLNGEEFGLVWHHLPSLERRGVTGGVASMMSLVDYYDQEFAHRVEVAKVAKAGSEPLVGAFGKNECPSCPFRVWCAEQAGPEDASFGVRSGFSDREWSYLYARGLGTLPALGAAELSDDLLEGFGSADHGVSGARKRLGPVVERARMVHEGVMFERKAGTGPWSVPCADVEIDFDVEWSTTDNLVYLWGARVRYFGDEASATYEHSVYSFEPLDEDSAHELAMRFFGWLEAFVAEKEAAGLSVGIYHWTSPEMARSVRVLGNERALRLFGDRSLDLKVFTARHYVAREGFGLKKVAPVFGFEWSSEDAGGLVSTLRIEEAKFSPDPQVRQEAREWLLAYNRDDCAAQAAVRDGLAATRGRAQVLCPSRAGSPAL
jgi:predicted RecB family nuclease